MSFRYALSGLGYCIRTQRNFRIHLAVAVAVVTAGAALRLPAAEWAVLVVVIALVLAAEMVNTVVEAVVDLITTDVHPLAKVAKDVAAGVVLLTALCATAAGSVIFGRRLWTWLMRSQG